MQEEERRGGKGWPEDNDDIRYRKNVLLMRFLQLKQKKKKNLAKNLDVTGSTLSLGITHHGCGLIPAAKIDFDGLGKVLRVKCGLATAEVAARRGDRQSRSTTPLPCSRQFLATVRRCG